MVNLQSEKCASDVMVQSVYGVIDTRPADLQGWCDGNTVHPDSHDAMQQLHAIASWLSSAITIIQSAGPIPCLHCYQPITRFTRVLSFKFISNLVKFISGVLRRSKTFKILTLFKITHMTWGLLFAKCEQDLL